MNPRLPFVLASFGLGLLLPRVQALDSGPPAKPSDNAVRIDPAVYQSVVDQNIELRKDRDRLSKDLLELRKRNASLLLEIQDLERRRDSLTAVVAEMKMPDEATAESARLRSERTILLRELERLRQAVGLIPTNPPPSSAPAPGSDLFRRVEKENADLRAQLANARDTTLRETRSKETLAVGGKDLEARGQALAAQVSALQKELDASRKNEEIMKAALVRLARKTYVLKTETQTLREQAAQREAAAKAREPRPAPASAPSLPSARAPGAAGTSLAEQGRAALEAGQAKEAEKLLLAAAKEEPDNAGVHYSLGLLYDDYLNNPGEAAIHYRKYLELKPEAPDASTVQSWLMELDLKSKW